MLPTHDYQFRHFMVSLAASSPIRLPSHCQASLRLDGTNYVSEQFAPGHSLIVLRLDNQISNLMSARTTQSPNHMQTTGQHNVNNNGIHNKMCALDAI